MAARRHCQVIQHLLLSPLYTSQTGIQGRFYVRCRYNRHVQSIHMKGQGLKPSPIRLDVLVAITLSFAVLMYGQSWLSMLWGFGLHRLTVTRWDTYLRQTPRFTPISFGKKLLCLAAILLAAGVAHVLSAFASVLSSQQERTAALLALGCAAGLLASGALVVSRFVNTTWKRPK